MNTVGQQGVSVFAGTLGSGKTLNAVRFMIKSMFAGRLVCTNIELKMDKAQDFCRLEFGGEFDERLYRLVDDADMIHFYRNVPRGTADFPVLVVLDEVSEWFDALRGSLLDEVESVFRHARKLSVQFILITQMFNHLQKRLRERVDFVYHHYDYRMLRIPLIDLPLFPWHLCRVMKVARINQQTHYISTERFKPPKSLYGAYDTRQMYRSHGLSTEEIDGIVGVKAEKEGLKMGLMWKIAIVGNLLVGGLLWHQMRGLDASTVVVAGATGVESESVVVSLVEADLPGTVSARLDGVAQGDVVYALIDGNMYQVGDPSPFGMCQSVSTDRAIFGVAGGELTLITGTGVSRIGAVN